MPSTDGKVFLPKAFSCLTEVDATGNYFTALYYYPCVLWLTLSKSVNPARSPYNCSHLCITQNQAMQSVYVTCI